MLSSVVIMPQVHKGRFTAQIEGDFVIFLIGMRINRLLLFHKWLPVLFAMPRMLTELFKHPEMGLLHAQTFLSGRIIMVVQYWRSFDQLHVYAHAKNLEHLPAWAAFNRQIGDNGAVGIFHETYVVPAGSFECVYGNMPQMGLAKAGKIVPAVGRLSGARERLNANT